MASLSHEAKIQDAGGDLVLLRKNWADFDNIPELLHMPQPSGQTNLADEDRMV
jgi:hypothetical protein